MMSLLMQQRIVGRLGRRMLLNESAIKFKRNLRCSTAQDPNNLRIYTRPISNTEMLPIAFNVKTL